MSKLVELSTWAERRFGENIPCQETLYSIAREMPFIFQYRNRGKWWVDTDAEQKYTGQSTADKLVDQVVNG